jgi:hypothetical protein
MGFQFNPITGNLDLVESGGGGNPFDQSLNTTNDVSFNSVNTIGASLENNLTVNGSGSFAVGAATIGADGTASFYSGNATIGDDGSGGGLISINGTTNANNPATAQFYSGAFVMKTNGTTRGTMSLDDSSSRINFVNTTSFASIYMDDSGNTGIGPYYGSPVIIDGSSNMTVPGNITAANLPTTFFDGDAANLTGTLADARLSSSVAMLTSTQTLTNKTLTAPVISNGSTSAILTADASNILAQRNGTNAQSLRVYGTFTDASNYERGVFDWSTNSGQLTIGTQKAGTGQNRVTRIQASGQVDIYPFDLQSVRFSSTTSIFYIPIEWAYYSAATDPTTATIGSGRCAVYRNTTSGAVKLWVNAAGTMRSVTLA